jgi:MSHA pilin protein MshD
MGTWELGSMGAMARRRGCRARAPILPRTRASRRGFTLVEVLLTILVIGVGLTASMRAMPVLIQVSRATHEQLIAQQLATDMLAEISMLPYEEPDSTPAFGPESGERTTVRADFDDIDDYDGWAKSPPIRKDGVQEPNSIGFTRSVTVQNVLATNFTSVVSDGGSDAKRITITVTLAGMPDLTITTVRLKGSNREDL